MEEMKKHNPEQLIVIVVPELVQPRWWEYLLHNKAGAALTTLLFLRGDERVVVINTPWYLREE